MDNFAQLLQYIANYHTNFISDSLVFTHNIDPDNIRCTSHVFSKVFLTFYAEMIKNHNDMQILLKFLYSVSKYASHLSDVVIITVPSKNIDNDQYANLVKLSESIFGTGKSILLKVDEEIFGSYVMTYRNECYDASYRGRINAIFNAVQGQINEY